MNVKNCKNCSGELQSDFEYCPHCGERTVTTQIESYLEEFIDHPLHEHCSWRKIKPTEYYLEIPPVDTPLGTVSFGTNLPEPWRISNVWDDSEETLVSITDTERHFICQDD